MYTIKLELTEKEVEGLLKIFNPKENINEDILRELRYKTALAVLHTSWVNDHPELLPKERLEN